MTPTSPERGWAKLEHPELYADLQAAGSLAAALWQAAAEEGLDFGAVPTVSSNQLLSVEIGEAPRFHRAPLAVMCGASKRSFLVSGWIRGVYTLNGGTSDLREVARAARSWQSGAPLADIQRDHPWIVVEEMAFAHERGPAEAVAMQWSRLRAQMRDEQFDLGIRAAEAAYAEPRLRQLFPYTSHWVLCFTRCTGNPFTRDVPCIAYASSLDGYVVRWPGWGDTTRVLGETGTAEEAVALVVANLPEGTGPAVAGTADDL